LASFISHNYDPIKPPKKSDSPHAYVLALSAQLLFVSSWDLNKATATFAAIAAAAGKSDQTLGNVIGLNPFHDYKVWELLRQLQAIGIVVPENASPKAEREQIEKELRFQFPGAPSTPPEAIRLAIQVRPRKPSA